MNKKYYMLILLGLGLLTHFMFFGHPDETVFDEVHFGKFVSGYYTHEYFFDIHPPLGKMGIAGFGKLFNFQPEFAFAEIGDAFPDNQYKILRFLPALAGALLPLVIFLLLFQLGLPLMFAFLGGLLILLENALLTQSLYILMDAFLLLFGFLALLFYFKSKKTLLHQTRYILLFGLFAGLSVSIKWTGLSFLALPLVIEFFSILKSGRYKDVRKLGIPLAVAIIVYFSMFVIHFSLLNQSGSGDAFMSQGFQKTLVGNQFENDNEVNASNIFQKFTELNAEMYKANQRLDAEHPYSSPWYTWPFMKEPIYYWFGDDARVYLIGNPVIWWLSTAAVLILVLRLFEKVFMPSSESKVPYIVYFLLGGYALNILPFVGVGRVMFLYHYFTAYIFAIMMMAYLISQMKYPKKVVLSVLAVAVIIFIYFTPLNYGFQLTPEGYESRMWFESWK